MMTVHGPDRGREGGFIKMMMIGIDEVRRNPNLPEKISSVNRLPGKWLEGTGFRAGLGFCEVYGFS